MRFMRLFPSERQVHSGLSLISPDQPLTLLERQSILHPERIVGNPEVIPRNVGEERALPPQNNSVKTIVIARAEPAPGSGKRLKLSQLVWLRGTEKLLKQKTRAA